MMSKSYGDHRAQTATPSVSLSERPEQALFHLSVSVETESASAALPLLKRSVTRLEELLPPLGARLTITDFDLPSAEGKVSELVSQLHASLTVPFAPETPFWERAQKLAQVDGLLRALVLEGKKQKPPLLVRSDLPVFVVADPELRRAALVNRLQERARSLGPHVALKDLRFDRPVEQRSVSLEEVQLTLSVEGVAEVAFK
ncbi:MAG: hypothetical protein Q8S42_34475 [Archangium sp.]|nr:hypothetical protein [Archangium sp.]